MRTESGKVFYGWWVVVGLFCVSVIGMGGRAAITALGPTISRDMGWTASEIAVGVTIALLVYAASCVFVGRLIDTVGGSKVVTIGGALLTAGLVILSRVNDLRQFYLIYGGLLGVAVSMTQTVPDQSIARKWFIKHSALVGSILSIAISAFLAVGFPLVVRGGVHYGWRATLLAYAAFGVVILVIGRLLIRDTPESVGLRPYGSEDRSPGMPGAAVVEEPSVPPRQALRTLSFWGLALGYGIFATVYQGLVANIAFWGESVGTSRASVGLFMTAFSVPAMFAKIAWGFLGDRYGKRKVAVIGGVLCVAVFVAGGLWVRDALSLYILCIAYGIAYTHFVIAVPYMGDLFGRRHIGTLTGYIMAPHGFLGSFGPILWSKLFEASGSYRGACLVSAGIYVLVTLGWAVAKPIKRTAGTGPVERAAD